MYMIVQKPLSEYSSLFILVPKTLNLLPKSSNNAFVAILSRL